MKCPSCSADIKMVIVTSEVWQKADIDEKGKITDYWGIEEITDTLKIECPECYADISLVVKE